MMSSLLQRSSSLNKILQMKPSYLLQINRSMGYKGRPFVNTSQLQEGRRTGVLAMKVGMLGIWDRHGERHACTVVQLDHVHVVQHKTVESDGYESLKLSVGEIKPKNCKRSLMGQYQNEKVNIPLGRQLKEFRITPDCSIPIGTRLRAMHFVPGQLVDVCGTSKGKGFQGVMKRHNFKGGSASHGNSKNHRTAGSTGACQDPGRTWKGTKMPGRMGGKRITTQNIKVVRIDPDRDLIYLSGSVPGPNGSFLRLTDAVKGPFYPSDPPYPTFIEGEHKIPETDDECWAPLPVKREPVDTIDIKM